MQLKPAEICKMSSRAEFIMDYWNWKLLFLLIINIGSIQCDIFHYYKIQKFLTAVAFARALGKRPTILPIPIPIPIPIAQNEVIKLPIKSGSKTIMVGGGHNSKGLDADSILSGLGGSSYGGSSNYGYSLPGISSDKIVSLSPQNTAPRIIVLGGQNGNGLSNNILGSTALPNNNVIFTSGLAGNLLGGTGQYNIPAVNGFAGIPGNFRQSNFLGNGDVSFDDDLIGAFSLKSPSRFKLPHNIRQRNLKQMPHNFHNNLKWKNGGLLARENGSSKQSQNGLSSSYEHMIDTASKPKKPIPIGEKFSLNA